MENTAMKKKKKDDAMSRKRDDFDNEDW